MTDRIAVYVAGDAGIYFPGLVALTSIQKHNASHPFDYYMCFDGPDLTSEMADALAKHDIHFVDTADLNEYGDVHTLPAMGERRWPVHVFYNWVIPQWLHDQGYQTAIKADYDLLCTGRYYMPDIHPGEHTIAALTFPVDLIGQGVPTGSLTEAGIAVENGKAAAPYYNAGFVTINLKRFVGADTFTEFRRVYQSIHKDGAKVVNAEQAALAIVAYQDDMPLKSIPEPYNQRIVHLPALDAEGMPVLKNVHYLTQNKPWLPPDYRYLKGYTETGRTAVYLYRNLWHEYAHTLEGYSSRYGATPPKALEILGMHTEILRAYHQRA